MLRRGWHYLTSMRSPQLRSEFTTHSWLQPKGYNTGITVYNCVERKLIPLILSNEHFATWYTCGPTGYDSTHIGHASCYVKIDIIQRILRKFFKVNLVTAMNITDIDDKIIARSKENGMHWSEISKKYEADFWDDLKKLNVEEPNIKIRVTENIPEIIAFIQKILDKKLAYIGKDSSVYFKVHSYSNYGKLQKVNLENEGHNIKDSALDFALWKSRKGDEPYWESPWGPGRPGWHIECSALASKIFGNRIDFHAGGLDLKFPHHENEEAQSCAYHETTQWVNYWVHTGHLNLKGQDKMSKSLKNTITVDELLETYSSDDFRMACLLSNYKSSMEFGIQMMETARNTLYRFIDFNTDCQAYVEGKKSIYNPNGVEIMKKIEETKTIVYESLKDDFNTAKCIGQLIDLSSTISREINAKSLGDNYGANCIDTIMHGNNYLKELLQMFGLQFLSGIRNINDNVIDVNKLINEIIIVRKEIRNEAIQGRKQDLFKICDDIRDILKGNGIEIKDHSKGTTWNITNKK